MNKNETMMNTNRDELFGILKREQPKPVVINSPANKTYIDSTIKRHQSKKDSTVNYSEAYISLANHYLC